MAEELEGEGVQLKAGRKTQKDDAGAKMKIQLRKVEHPEQMAVEEEGGEEVIRILQPLKSVTVQEEETVALQCEINKLNADVTWVKDGTQLPEKSEHIVMESSGTIYKLKVAKALMSDAGKYEIRIGEKKSACDVVVKEKPLKFVRELRNARVTEEDAVEFLVQLNKEAPKVTWTKDGKEIAPCETISFVDEGATHKLLIPKSQLSDAAVYAAVAEGKMSKAKLEVGQKPIQFVRPLEPKKCMEEDMVEMECEINKDNAKVTWQKDGRVIAQSERYQFVSEGRVHKLKIPAAELKDGGLIAVVVGDQKVTSKAKLEVAEKPLQIVKPLEPKEVAVEEVVAFTVELNKPNVEVQWFKNGKRIAASEGFKFEKEGCCHTMKIPAAKVEHAAKYEVKVKQLTSTADLKVVQKPKTKTPSPAKDVKKEESPGLDIQKKEWKFVEPLKDQTGTETEFVVFTCKTSIPKVPIQWFHNGKEVEPSVKYDVKINKDEHTLAVNLLEMTDIGEVKAVFKKAECTAKLGVIELDRFIKTPPKDVRAIVGQEATFTAEVSVQDMVVEWSFDDQVIEKSDFTYDIQKRGIKRILTIKKVKREQISKKAIIRWKEQKCPAKLLDKLEGLKVLTPLKDQKVKEGQPIELQCEYSIPDVPAVWSKDGIDLDEEALKHFVPTTKGKVYSLKVREAKENDAGKFEIRLGDLSTNCKVTVSSGSRTPSDSSKLSSPQPLSRKSSPEPEKLKAEKTSPLGSGKSTPMRKSPAPEGSSRAGSEESDIVRKEWKFVEPLKDQRGRETEYVIFTCKTSIPKVPVDWFHNGQPVDVHSPKYDVKINKDEHSLHISLLEMTDDTTDVKAVFKKAETNAKLFVDELDRHIRTPPKDVTCRTGDEAAFECVVSVQDMEVEWTLNGKVMDKSDMHYEISKRGINRYFAVKKVKKDDFGDVTVRYKDDTRKAKIINKLANLKVLKPLQDVKVKEGADATLRCEFSIPDLEAEWFKNGQLLRKTEDERVKWQVQGKVYSLKIGKAREQDADQYEVHIDDVQSKCKVEVDVPLRIVRGLEPLKIKEGEKAVFEAETNKPNQKPQWLKNGKPFTPDGKKVKAVTDGRLHRLEFENGAPADGATYTIKFGDQTSAAPLDVEETALVFIRKLGDITLTKYPEKTVLECELNKPNVKVTWTKNGSPVDKTRTQVQADGCVHRLTLLKGEPVDEGDYQCSVNKDLATNGKVDFKVPPTLKVDKYLDKTLEIKTGAKAEFDVPFTGCPRPKFTVTFNGKELPDANRMKLLEPAKESKVVLQITNGIRSDSGVYTLVAENECGKVTGELRLLVKGLYFTFFFFEKKTILNLYLL